MFEFGGGSSQEGKVLKVKDLNQEKLSDAPVHNLDSERAVGAVNYGLKVRGAKQIKSVSSSLVKARAAELIEGKEVTKEMKQVMKKGGAVPEILEAWEKKQSELKKQGMEDKEISNIAEDKRRISDLATLTGMGGPFTKSDQVQRFLEDPSLDDSLKNKRMYLEVRYAKLSSLSFPKSSDVFRLKKKGKNLSSAEYATNLNTYLGKVTCNVNMGFEDFQEALRSIENE